jgi:phage-related protein
VPVVTYSDHLGSSLEDLRTFPRASHQEGQFRVIYVANIDDAVHVLHAFQKKTQQTRKQDIKIARQRLKQIREK